MSYRLKTYKSSIQIDESKNHTLLKEVNTYFQDKTTNFINYSF